jgi:phage major head subunit gpT-like protein
MSVHIDSNVTDRVYSEWDKTLMDPSLPETPVFHPAIAVEVPASSRSTLYTWFVNNCLPRAWKGKRHYNDIASMLSWRVFNEIYELSYQYDAREEDDDVEGIVQNAVMSAMNDRVKWRQWEDYKVALALEAGNTSLCYDGQNMFDDAHPIDPTGVVSGTYDNDLALALSNTNLETALLVMRQDMKDPSGMPIVSNEPIRLVTCEAMRKTAMEAVYNGVVSTGAARGLFSANAPAPNIVTQAVQLEINPYLNLDGQNPTTWYLTRKSGIVLPLMLRRRSGLERTQSDRNSDHYMDTGKLRFGATAGFAVTYTRPDLALRSKP